MNNCNIAGPLEIQELKDKIIRENGNYDFFLNLRELAVLSLVFDSLLAAIEEMVSDCGTNDVDCRVTRPDDGE